MGASGAMAILWLFSTTCSPAQSPPQSAPDDSIVVKTEGITVNAQRDKQSDSLTQTSSSSALADIARRAGAATLVDADAIDQRESFSLQSSMANQPGLLVQDSAGGNDTPRLSIRGSGIQSAPVSRGIGLYQDGMPLNLSDGSYITTVLEPLASQYVEVFRGASAMGMGVPTLGGGINFVSPTGLDPLSRARFEAGTNDYFRGAASSGFTANGTDVWLSATHASQSGYRDRSEQTSEHVNLNIGHRFTKNFESRLFFLYSTSWFQEPGPLTYAQADANPRSNWSVVTQDRPTRTTDFVRLGDRSTLRLDDARTLEDTVYWMHVNDNFAQTRTLGISHSNDDDFGNHAVYTDTSDLLDHGNTFTTGTALSIGNKKLLRWNNVNSNEGKLIGNNLLTSGTVTWNAGDDYKLAERLTLQTGIETDYTYRDIRERFPVSASHPDTARSYGYYGADPKAGLLYDFGPGKEEKKPATRDPKETIPPPSLAPAWKGQLFADISRQFEAPTFDDLLVASTPAPPTTVGVVKLKPQTETTIETGTRGEAGFAAWDATFYHSWVQDEILRLVDANGNSLGAVNANKTTHEGVETKFDFTVAKGLAVADKDHPDKIVLETVYTWSHFNFSNDSSYGNNQIGGIPEHMAFAEAVYRHPCGFYTGPNVTWMVTKTPADHAHTLFYDPYATLGYRIGYEVKQGLSGFVDLENLLDKNYVSSTAGVIDHATPASPIFRPGTGFTADAGVEYRW